MALASPPNNEKRKTYSIAWGEDRKKHYAVFGFSLKKQDERNEGKKNEEKRREWKVFHQLCFLEKRTNEEKR